jgi:hypothetical protein
VSNTDFSRFDAMNKWLDQRHGGLQIEEAGDGRLLVEGVGVKLIERDLPNKLEQPILARRCIEIDMANPFVAARRRGKEPT